jgi:scyllo-inositol 2-dehydrogenase (NADP+)
MVGNPIKIGVVGAGWVANARHIPAFQRDSRCKVTAIFDRNQEKAINTARKYGIPTVYLNYQDFLNSGIDVVVICTPPMSHTDLAKEALLAKKHVLTEKPFSLTVDSGKENEKLAASLNLILFPAHNFLFSRGMIKIREELQKQDVGKILHVSGYQWSSWSRALPSWYHELPGGLFFDEGPHLMYLMKDLIGEFSISSAVWSGRNLETREPFENYEITVEGEKATGNFSMFFGSPMSEWQVVIMCEKKTFVYDIFRDFYFKFAPEVKRTRIYPIGVIASFDYQIWKQYIIWIFKRYVFGKSHLCGSDIIASKFLDAVTGKASPALVPKDGYNAIEKLLEILDKSGRSKIK